MARKNFGTIRAAAQGTLVEGEQVTEFGTCWAAQIKPRAPVLFTRRRLYLMVLTDRRLLLFKRRLRRPPQPSDLVIGKRYESFTLVKTRRGFPLMQVRVAGSNEIRMVFEFRPAQRQLGGALAARLTPRSSRPAADEPAPSPDDTAAAATTLGTADADTDAHADADRDTGADDADPDDEPTGAVPVEEPAGGDADAPAVVPEPAATGRPTATTRRSPARRTPDEELFWGPTRGT